MRKSLSWRVRSSRNVECEAATCSDILIGYGRLNRYNNTHMGLNAAIKAKVRYIALGNNPAILLDEIQQLFPNDTHMLVNRRMRWPLNCHCPQIRNNGTFIILGHMNSKYKFDFSTSKAIVGRLVYDQQNFRNRAMDDVKDKVLVSRKSNYSVETEAIHLLSYPEAREQQNFLFSLLTTEILLAVSVKVQVGQLKEQAIRLTGKLLKQVESSVLVPCL